MKNSKGFLNILSVIVIGISIFVVLIISLFLLFNFLIDLTAGNIFGTITTTIIILLIGYNIHLIVRRGFDMRQLAIEGVETTGTVTRKLTFRWGGSIRRYQIKYSYYDNFGKKHYNTSLISWELYNRLSVGDPIKVVFLPTKTSVSALLSDVEIIKQKIKGKSPP
jgi:hypothetical protein